MRVVSGSARGCRLQPVPGMNTRPTTDRVKENVFNLIQDHVRDADVLDLFAGTGQLGIEALSRGAAHCDFIEHNGTAYNVVSKNVQTARVQDRASLHRVEARCTAACFDPVTLILRNGLRLGPVSSHFTRTAPGGLSLFPFPTVLHQPTALFFGASGRYFSIHRLYRYCSKCNSYYKAQPSACQR